MIKEFIIKKYFKKASENMDLFRYINDVFFHTYALSKDLIIFEII